jgi:hypothetical protein
MSNNLTINFGTITQGSRPTISFTWPLPANHTPADWTGATLSGVLWRKENGDVYEITGALTVVTPATRALTWALSADDSGTAGNYVVVLRAAIGSLPIYTSHGSLHIVANPEVSAVHGPALVGVPAALAAWLAAVYAGLATADAGQVLTADGVGGADWQDPTGGGGIDDVAAAGLYGREIGEWTLLDAAAVGADTAGSASAVQGNLDTHTGDTTIHFTQAAISITPAQAGAAAARPAQTDIAGTTHTFVLANEGQIVASQSGSATEFTIPLNSAQAFPVGAIVGAEQQGAGVLTIKATSGVTLNGADGASKAITAQWGAVAIRKTGVNAWVIIGSFS